MKIKSVFIENYKVLRDFKIDFTNNGEINPVTVLAGINGSGKTTFLDFIFETLKKQKFPNFNKSSFIEINELEDENSRILNNNYKLNNDFFKEIKGEQSLNISDKILYYKAGEENIPAKKIITDFIDELIYEKDIQSSQVYNLVRERINDILAGLNLQIEFSRIDKNKEIYFRNSQSEDIKLSDLSGGEKEIITKVLPLFISSIKNSIILIDEPESSLHPNWQNEIINLYNTNAIQNNNQIIIATHSPHIVSAIDNGFVKLFYIDGQKIRLIDVSSKTYGRRVDEILLDIFKVN